MLKDFEQLLEKVRKQPKRNRLIVVSAHDRHTLEAVLCAYERGAVRPVLLGRGEEIERIFHEEFPQRAGELRVIDEKEAFEEKEIPPEDGIGMIHCLGDEEAARKAVTMVRNGQGDGIMKGGCRTSALLKQVVPRNRGLGKGGLMSHVGLFKVPGYHKLIALTDGGMVPHPTVEEKEQQIVNAVNLMKKLGYDNPKVACLAAGEDVNKAAPETVDGANLKERNRQGELKGCIVEGPISYDLAISREAAIEKKYESPVAGDADILLVPNMAAGNILAKSWIVSGGGIMAGVIAGASVPIIVPSRSASSQEKFLSIMLAVACGFQGA